jgi:hypothetical protein
MADRKARVGLELEVSLVLGTWSLELFSLVFPLPGIKKRNLSFPLGVSVRDFRDYY